MKIFDVEMIHDFAKQHADARSHLIGWLDDTKRANWQNPNDIK